MLPDLKIEVTYQELLNKIKISTNVPELPKIVEKELEQLKGIWRPGAVLRWFKIKNIEKTRAEVILPEDRSSLFLNLGFSIEFLKEAKYILIAVYTVREKIVSASMMASSKGNFLEAYLIDLIALIVLDKTCQGVKNIAEKQAMNLGWGVGPFLSPGSVHGWEIGEQIKLCSLLPLEKINVKIRPDAVLSPFKTVSCLIGIGPGYDALQVGTTCQVCSKNHECQMKQS